MQSTFNKSPCRHYLVRICLTSQRNIRLSMILHMAQMSPAQLFMFAWVSTRVKENNVAINFLQCVSDSEKLGNL